MSLPFNECLGVSATGEKKCTLSSSAEEGTLPHRKMVCSEDLCPYLCCHRDAATNMTDSGYLVESRNRRMVYLLWQGRPCTERMPAISLAPEVESGCDKMTTRAGPSAALHIEVPWHHVVSLPCCGIDS